MPTFMSNLSNRSKHLLRKTRSIMPAIKIAPEQNTDICCHWLCNGNKPKCLEVAKEDQMVDEPKGQWAWAQWLMSTMVNMSYFERLRGFGSWQTNKENCKSRVVSVTEKLFESWAWTRCEPQPTSWFFWESGNDNKWCCIICWMSKTRRQTYHLWTMIRDTDLVFLWAW